jgi:ABC-type branched-subunit amino acid transport system substrate-binding protein
MIACIRALAAAVIMLLVCARVGGAADLKPVPGFDGKTITIGELLPLTGPAANFGFAVANGVKAWLAELNNEKGGIAGRYKVEPRVEDNALDQAMSVQSYNKMKNQVAMIAMSFATHTTMAILPQIREDKLLVSVEGADEQFFRERNLLPVGATYQVIAINAIDYLAHEQNAQNKVFCGLIRNDPYGTAGLAGLKFAIEKLHLNLAFVAHFTIGDQDFSGQVAQLKGANCDYVYATTIPPQLVRLVGNLVRIRFAPTIVAQFPSWTGTLVNSPAMDFFEQHLLVAGEGTEWGDDQSPQMTQMIASLKKYTPDQKPDFFFLMGYRCAMASTAVLEKAAANGDIDREGLLAALDSINTMHFGGLAGEHRYGPVNQREAPRSSSVFKANRKEPYGLEGLKVNFASPTVALYEGH